MKIYTLWQHEGDETAMPWLVNAIDEYTIEENDGFTADYTKDRAKLNVREIILDVPDRAVTKLFQSPEVKATVCEPEE